MKKVDAILYDKEGNPIKVKRGEGDWQEPPINSEHKDDAFRYMISLWPQRHEAFKEKD